MMKTITLELSPDLETKLKNLIAVSDTESIRQLLAEALVPTVRALLTETPEFLDNKTFEELAEQLTSEFTTYISPNSPTLSDYAVSRAGIYEEHP